MTRRPFVALLLVASCTADRPVPERTALPSPAPARGPVVAVVREGTLSLHEVDDAAPALRPLEVTAPAPPGRVESVSVSAGTPPTVCAVWADGPRRSLACDRGRGSWEPVAAAESRPAALVAVSHDGRRVAFAAVRPDTPEGEADVHVASLDGGRTIRIGPRRTPHPAGYCCGIAIESLAWSGPDTLLLSEGRESDDSTMFRRVPVPSRWWTEAPDVPASAADRRAGYTVFGRAVSPAPGARVLAVQRGYELDDDAPTRAVTVDVTTGEVAEVVSVPAAGRRVTHVSGGARGVLYATAGADVRWYWRRPGEAHGRPLAGLPEGDDVTAVAQA